MKATPLAAAAFSLLTASAFGADLGVPLGAPPVPPPFTWTSCYAGVQAGGAWGQTNLNDSAVILSPFTGFTSANTNMSGFLLGGQIGCDYQFAPNWVAGIEGAAAGEISEAPAGSQRPAFPATAQPSLKIRIC